MARSKLDLIEAIKAIESEMKWMLDKICVKPEHLTLHEEVESLPMDMLREGYKWLQGIYETKYVAWSKIRKSIPEDQWKRYELWGDGDDFQESILLKNVGVRLRELLVGRDRPDLFKKTKVKLALSAKKKKKK